MYLPFARIHLSHRLNLRTYHRSLIPLLMCPMHHPNHHRLSGASLSLSSTSVVIEGSSQNSRPHFSIHLRHRSGSTISAFRRFLRLLIMIPADEKALSLDTDVAMTEIKSRASETKTGHRGELIPTTAPLSCLPSGPLSSGRRESRVARASMDQRYLKGRGYVRDSAEGVC